MKAVKGDMRGSFESLKVCARVLMRFPGICRYRFVVIFLPNMFYSCGIAPVSASTAAASEEVVRFHCLTICSRYARFASWPVASFGARVIRMESLMRLYSFAFFSCLRGAYNRPFRTV